MTDWRETVGNSTPVMDSGGGRSSAQMQTGQSIGPIQGVEVQTMEVNPDPVITNGNVTVVVNVVETAELVSPFDPDVCNPEGISLVDGIKTRVTVNPDWAEPDSRDVCVPVGAIGPPGNKELLFNFTAPSTQAAQEVHAINVSLETPGSGAGPETESLSLTVTGSGNGGAGCSTNNDCPDGFVCQNGQCVPEGTDGNGGGGGGSGLVNFAVENPILAGAIGVGGIVVLRTATETVIGGE